MNIEKLEITTAYAYYEIDYEPIIEKEMDVISTHFNHYTDQPEELIDEVEILRDVDIKAIRVCKKGDDIYNDVAISEFSKTEINNLKLYLEIAWQIQR